MPGFHSNDQGRTGLGPAHDRIEKPRCVSIPASVRLTASRLVTLRTSSNAAENVENTSYATLATVSDRTMCWNARCFSSCRSSSSSAGAGQRGSRTHSLVMIVIRTVRKSVDGFRRAWPGLAAGVVPLPLCDPLASRTRGCGSNGCRALGFLVIGALGECRGLGFRRGRRGR